MDRKGQKRTKTDQKNDRNRQTLTHWKKKNRQKLIQKDKNIHKRTETDINGKKLT